MASSVTKLPLPPSFPLSNYTPFGYLDNPYHSGVFNRSGVIRTVPPMGFGWWAHGMPWSFGMDVAPHVSYLSFLHLSIAVEPAPDAARDSVAVFHHTEDFRTHRVELSSRYHTKTLQSYDWTYRGLSVQAAYFLAHENALVCRLQLANSGAEAQRVTVFATNIYGYPDRPYWGKDGLTTSYRADDDTAVSKVWAYGHVMLLGADRPSAGYKATASLEQWNSWIYNRDLSTNDGTVVRFGEADEPVYAVMAYPVELAPSAAESLTLVLARGVNELATSHQFQESLRGAEAALTRQLAEDEAFYAQAPLLTGDWPATWHHGWVYDFETLRMTIRPPLGIFKHPWDGMQIHTPRAVLGETCLDVLSLSYADMVLAKEVLYGVFADAPMPNVPCTREDGSMNMIGESGAECGTALTWGFPFLVIQSMYERDGDDAWLASLYPYLKAFIDWWLANRTDADGWFHADNSWESGQDGSRRFVHGEAREGAPAHFVRTVDIEAGMAHAMLMMVEFARIAGRPEDAALWQQLAEDRVRRTRSMYVDGWFRDWDAIEERPFLLDDYYDVMMLVPLSVGVATAEQVAGVRPKFELFSQQPTPFLEWPSFWLPFAEAGWHADLRLFIADELAKVGNRVYARTDARSTVRAGARYADRLPAAYSFRIPGVACEFWPVRFSEPFWNGCENYGWGATFPALLIRNLIGFREAGNPAVPSAAQDDATRRFTLAPALPHALLDVGRTYGITNLHHGSTTFDVRYLPRGASALEVQIVWSTPPAARTWVQDAAGHMLAEMTVEGTLNFSAENGALYEVHWDRS